MPTVVLDPPVLVNTTLLAAVAGQRIVPIALYAGQNVGIGFLATIAAPGVPIGPRFDAGAGAMQIAYALASGLFDIPVGDGLLFNNGFSGAGIASHITLRYFLELT